MRAAVAAGSDSSFPGDSFSHKGSRGGAPEESFCAGHGDFKHTTDVSFVAKQKQARDEMVDVMREDPLAGADAAAIVRPRRRSSNGASPEMVADAINAAAQAKQDAAMRAAQLAVEDQAAPSVLSIAGPEPADGEGGASPIATGTSPGKKNRRSSSERSPTLPTMGRADSRKKGSKELFVVDAAAGRYQVAQKELTEEQKLALSQRAEKIRQQSIDDMVGMLGGDSPGDTFTQESPESLGEGGANPHSPGAERSAAAQTARRNAEMAGRPKGARFCTIL